MFRILPIFNASSESISQLMCIRNSDRIRKFMFNSDLIQHDQHHEWISKRKLLFGVSEESYVIENMSGIAIGFFRFWFDDKLNSGNWGMYTDLNQNNYLLGVYAEFNALDYFFRSAMNKNDTIVSQVIMPNSIASLHEKIGFEKISFIDGILLMVNTRQRFDSCKARFTKALAKIK